MAVKTLPLDYDLVIYSGTTFRREFRWLPDGVTPIDFTGWSATMNIGVSHTVALLSLSAANGGITLSGTGQVIVKISPAQTLALPTGVLAYNLDLINPTTDVRRFLRGRVSVVLDVKDPP